MASNSKYWKREWKIYDWKNKDRIASDFILYMLARTQTMFTWSGLPDNIPQKDLERILQTEGRAGVIQYGGKIWALSGSPGGPPDPYGMPTQFVIANPSLGISGTFDIGKNCVVIPSDSFYMGLLPMARRYASMLTENEITMRIANINMRIVSLISAGDDRTRAAAEIYLKHIEAGDMAVAADNAFLESLRTTPYSTAGSSGQLTDLIEFEQYIKASWFNELGLNSNYNMKREAINSQEALKDRDALFPFTDNMLECRKKAVEQVNTIFGTNWGVEFGGVWAENRQLEETKEGGGE